MLTDIHPKLPMRNKSVTKDFYVNKLGFQIFGADYEGYLMVQKDQIQIHFFEFKGLDPKENYGQVYIRTDDIDAWYIGDLVDVDRGPHSERHGEHQGHDRDHQRPHEQRDDAIPVLPETRREPLASKNKG